MPGRYAATTSNGKWASRKNRHRSRCIMLGSWQDREAMAWTAAWLSHLQLTCDPYQSSPQMAHAITTARSSLKAMWWCSALKPAQLKPRTAPPPAGGVRRHLKFGWCCWWKQRHSIPMRCKGEPPPEVSAKLSVQSEPMMLTPGNAEQVDHSPQERSPRTNDTTCMVKKTHQRLEFTPCTRLPSGP